MPYIANERRGLHNPRIHSAMLKNRNSFNSRQMPRSGSAAARFDSRRRFDIGRAMETPLGEPRRSRAVTFEKYLLGASALLVACAVALAIFVS
ncbi:hypothetical protein [Burkholderia gladioli]|nr:hypothetical protein [Burkholderia gladioli]MBJ9664398.1 hypothetical protein [Burkholderia gladioli]MBU9170941.1 hypothetical protein [Burkholderia gladioli]MDN7727342.1 hypothetical protein [Burkholderia gladioli]